MANGYARYTGIGGGGGGGGGGTVTSVSVVSANGLAGTVATATTTPAITLSTTITGILQGNGTAISAATTGNLTDAGTDGIVITGGSGAVLGSGTSLAQHVADTTHNGYLSSTDWNTFNGKQASGNYITALTGDATAAGPGSAALTLATVNSNVGSFTYSSITVNAKGLVTAASNGTAPVTTLAAVGAVANANAATISGNTLNLQPFSSAFPGVVLASGGGTTNFLRADGTWAAPADTGITQLTGDVTAGPGSGSQAATLATVNANTGSFGSSTSIPNFTVNGKGLLTAAGSNVVIAPAGTLTGTTLAANVVTSSLTSVGTLTSGTWSATTIAVNKGGTGLTTLTANNVILGNGTSTPNFVAPSTSGNVLTSNGTTWVSSSSPFSGGAFFASSQVTTSDGGAANTSFTTATNSPALSFTPSVTGTYKVYASVPLQATASVGGSPASLRIFNTTGAGTLLQESQGETFGLATATATSSYAQSVYTLTAGVAYVFDIQTKIASGSVFVRGDFASFYMFAEGVVTGTGALSIGAFGSTPNSGGASISASTLTLQPASGTQPGGVSTAAQTFAGSKTLGENTSDTTTMGSASSTAIHQINGGLKATIRNQSSATLTVDTTTTDQYIFTDSTSNAITITLSAATAGRLLYIQDKTGTAGTNAITINPASGTINGLSTLVIMTNYGWASLVSDGTNWVASRRSSSGSSFLVGGSTFTTDKNVTPQTNFKLTIVGAGGGGGGTSSGTVNQKGGGAGSGGYGVVYLNGLSPNTGYTYSIGSHGTGSANANGTDGSASTITINAVAYTANGGTHGSVGPTGAGGAGGSNTNMTIAVTGGSGATGGSSSTASLGGQGGSNPLGQGAAPNPGGASGGINGSVGTGFGAGGGGGATGSASAANSSGGAGTDGCILVEWWT